MGGLMINSEQSMERQAYAYGCQLTYQQYLCDWYVQQ
jgi:hypothetical protein